MAWISRDPEWRPSRVPPAWQRWALETLAAREAFPGTHTVWIPYTHCRPPVRAGVDPPRFQVGTSFALDHERCPGWRRPWIPRILRRLHLQDRRALIRLEVVAVEDDHSREGYRVTYRRLGDLVDARDYTGAAWV